MATEKVVLIVDDDPSVLETMRMLLETKDGFRVHVALGSQGAAHILDSAHRVDVLIADVILAGSVTGIDVCHRAAARHPAVALVVISADSNTDAAMMPDYSIYLRKPFGGIELVAAIEEAERLALVRAASSETAG